MQVKLSKPSQEWSGDKETLENRVNSALKDSSCILSQNPETRVGYQFNYDDMKTAPSKSTRFLVGVGFLFSSSYTET